jgi:hypothetical protein
LSDCAQYFHLPETEAAKKLSIGSTTLKKIFIDMACLIGIAIFARDTNVKLPFDESKFKQLRHLSYEPNDVKLSKMPSSLRDMEFDGRLHSHSFQISSMDLQQLKYLRILRLVNFEKLKHLPEELGDQVNSLQELSLSDCCSIEKLPDSITKLQSLRILKRDVFQV